MRLVKIAKEIKKDENAGKKALAAGAVAAIAAREAPGQLTGYHKIYHGTGALNARKIKRGGNVLKASEGGIGGSADNFGRLPPSTKEQFKRNSAGKVHVTKSPIVAKIYAKVSSRKGEKGKVLKGKISHDSFRKLEHDKEGGPTKRSAARTSNDIHLDNSGKKFRTKSNLKKYLSTSHGKARFVKGIANAGLAAGSAIYGAKKLVEKARDSKKS